MCTGVPFGHTGPQWVLPYGGTMLLDGRQQTNTADHFRLAEGQSVNSVSTILPPACPPMLCVMAAAACCIG
nr:hypothetical protein [Arthrobacter sp. AQ5-05]